MEYGTETLSAEGTHVVLDPDTTSTYGVHVPTDAEKFWYRTVIPKSKAMHDALGTHFCLHMQKPAGAPKPKRIAKFNETKHLPSHKLWSVWLEVRLTNVASLREQKAINQFIEGGSELGISAQTIKYA